MRSYFSSIHVDAATIDICGEVEADWLNPAGGVEVVLCDGKGSRTANEWRR